MPAAGPPNRVKDQRHRIALGGVSTRRAARAYTRNAYAQYPWLRIADQGDYPVILGSKNWPMRVDWVRVWGKPQR